MAPTQSGAAALAPSPSLARDAATPRKQRVPPRIVAAAVAGNAMEFYDFTTYAFFAVYIGKTFFPASTPFMSLLLSVAVFGVGFVTRPLGGLLIGAFADRAGRKPAMILTIALITVGTLGLAATPSYAQIGVAAPIIVVFCRLLQGLALGGEVGPSTAYLIEVAPPGKRGLYGSWQLASQGVAGLCAGIVGVLLTLSLSAPHEQGANSSALQLSEGIAVASTLAISGSLFAATVGGNETSGYLLCFAVTLLLAGLATVVGRRIS